MPTNRTSTSVPPPSPIPTATGSRSAANETFIEYLESSLQPPHLAFPPSTRHPVPVEIDVRSLASRGRESVDRLLRSAREYGACRISGHGILGEELRSFVEAADVVFRNSDFVARTGNREEIVWALSPESEGKFINRNFSQIMENVARKLDAVAKQLIQVLMENADNKKFWKVMQEKETVVTLYRYHHNNDLLKEENPPLPNDHRNDKSFGHAISFHLHIDHCKFHVQSKRGLLSFEEGPDTIAITVGKQLEEWSLGEFKCVSGESITEPDIQAASQASYSLELKYISSSINKNFNNRSKTISLLDQVLFAVIVTFLYKVCIFLLT
ncbi:hypothetical protein I3842_09G223200 [Carya illinoinensis]|uniref:Uncharacterized protein n=1 Tax=Carya illinoinensis TaxID=32201 RepID=A0A922E6T5_CARIL|nr:hypothetical protein I3842_09G223200 [Carya illinoinensis]